MPSRASRRLLTYIVLPTAAASYGIHRGLSHLEATYPELPIDKTTSVALRTPSNPEEAAMRVYRCLLGAHPARSASGANTRQ
ncbi:hypothetical protein N7474_005906 [Penicillium riverlandense]|uniref:uncharacterized protein n=1 Tax=Penicillium riverlandense TaxID=1903569 RepID=UPI00254779ED|nr:uncharacterized protein N7474_005906 [Penicillium riverlandense]KAJ5820315.1 hypothetical protein N7474_005906 [Penicillium riverlandense]